LALAGQPSAGRDVVGVLARLESLIEGESIGAGPHSAAAMVTHDELAAVDGVAISSITQRRAEQVGIERDARQVVSYCVEK
jgi:hypothetical protein